MIPRNFLDNIFLKTSWPRFWNYDKAGTHAAKRLHDQDPPSMHIKNFMGFQCMKVFHEARDEKPHEHNGDGKTPWRLLKIFMKNSNCVSGIKTSWMGSSQKRHNPAVGQGWRNFINEDSKTSCAVFQISLFTRKISGGNFWVLGPHAIARFKYV